MCVCLFFFFKQKTAYEMRISDWSSDVCSSDLRISRFHAVPLRTVNVTRKTAEQSRSLAKNTIGWRMRSASFPWTPSRRPIPAIPACRWGDRKSVVSGKSVSVRVDLGGRRIIKKKNNNDTKDE